VSSRTKAKEVPQYEFNATKIVEQS
jgi:hypothetical protein